MCLNPTKNLILATFSALPCYLVVHMYAERSRYEDSAACHESFDHKNALTHVATQAQSRLDTNYKAGIAYGTENMNSSETGPLSIERPRK